jgi:hypothetical protein
MGRTQTLAADENVCVTLGASFARPNACHRHTDPQSAISNQQFGSRFRLRLAKAHDFVPGLELTAFPQQFDPLETFEHVALGRDGTGAFETAML